MNTFNRNLLWLLGAALLIAILYYFSNIVGYLLLAWVLSMLGRPLMVFFMRYLRIGRLRIGHSGAALLTILTFYLGVAAVLLIFVPTIIRQARNLAAVDYQALGEKLRQPFFNLDFQLHQIGLLTGSESLATRAQELFSTWFQPALLGNFLGSFLGAAGNVLVTFTVVTFILFFFLKDNRLFIGMLYALVPNELESKVRHAVQDSSNMLTRYFIGLVVQVFCFALSITLILWITGVKNALLLGIFGGIFNIIPYVGPIMGFILSCFVTISSNLDVEFTLLWPMLLKIAIAFMVTQMIDNNFLGPLIFSKSVQAHPLEIFIVTLVAAKLGGVLGMIIGIPVYTVLRVIGRVFFSEFKVVQRLTERLDGAERF